MAITSWTSEGMDWSSVEKIKLGSLYNHLEAIRLAVIERMEACGITLSGVFAKDYEIRLKKIKPICDAIQSAVTGLIPIFANYSNQEAWEGGAYDHDYYTTTGTLSPDFAPAWTIQEILSSIGSETRLTLDRLALLFAWIWQQYQILNSLRIIKVNPSIMQVSVRSYGKYGATWSELISGFNATPWRDYAYWTGNEAGHWGIKETEIGRKRMRLKYDALMSGFVDWYLPFWSNRFAFQTNEYQNADYPGKQKGIVYKIASNINVADYAIIGDFEGVSIPEPSSGVGIGWMAIGDDSWYGGDQAKGIYKPSFAFRDW